MRQETTGGFCAETGHGQEAGNSCSESVEGIEKLASNLEKTLGASSPAFSLRLVLSNSYWVQELKPTWEASRAEQGIR